MDFNFGEKKAEYSPKHGKELPVWQSPKYIEAKRKAIEIIESKKYDICEADFWILMNVTKSEKMAYTGLIISHNGCLKINDRLASKFNPDCVTYDKDGYNGSLVFHYCNAEHGIYEVGEVSKSNCKNEYPYAMAYKRLFDRVVLKLSKLAYSGIYSDSESEEFSQQIDASQQNKATNFDNNQPILCEDCGNQLHDVTKRDGEIWHPEEIKAYSERRFERCLCPDCMKIASDKKKR